MSAFGAKRTSRERRERADPTKMTPQRSLTPDRSMNDIKGRIGIDGWRVRSRCTGLSDAQVDVMGYACLVAIMSRGLGYHRASQERLERITRNNNAPAPVVTSAGALVDGLKVMRAKKIVVLTPYIKPLTKLIVDYIANEGYDVLDYVALGIPHNLDVARHDQNELPGIMQGMKIANADVLVLSACVQMPSLAVVPKVEALTGKPVVTASIATAYALLRLLNLEPVVPGAGALLSGAY